MFKLENKEIILPPKVNHFFQVAKISFIAFLVSIISIVIGGLLLKGIAPQGNGMDFSGMGFAVIGVIIIFVCAFVIYAKTFLMFWRKTFQIPPTYSDVILPVVVIFIIAYLFINLSN